MFLGSYGSRSIGNRSPPSNTENARKEINNMVMPAEGTTVISLKFILFIDKKFGLARGIK